jgi:hypothetical protein
MVIPNPFYTDYLFVFIMPPYQAAFPLPHKAGADKKVKKSETKVNS